MIKAVVFDLDDTLYEERAYVISGLKCVDQYIKDRFHIEGFFDQAISLFNKGRRKYIFNYVLQKLGVDYSMALIDELVDRYHRHRPNIRLLPDAEWALSHLADSMKIGLISDGRLISQRNKVAALGLENTFHSIILSDKYGPSAWKPNPRLYKEMSENLGISPGECVYIGDNVKKDFIAPKTLGWTTVQVRRKSGLYQEVGVGTLYRAHYLVSNLKELKQIPSLSLSFTEGDRVRI